MACGYFEHEGARGFVCNCDPEARWIAGIVADQAAEIERLRQESEPIRLDLSCDECGRRMHEDERGVLSCVCGERVRAG